MMKKTDSCRSVAKDNDRYEERRAEKLALVEYNRYYSCLNCNKKLSDVETVEFQKCSCGSYQRIQDCEKTVTLRIKIDKSDALWLTVFEEALKEFTEVTEPDELCALLLSSQNFVLQVDKSKSKVKSMSLIQEQSDTDDAAS